jgi:hypothetical protein
MGQYVISPERRARMLALLALAWDGQWFLKVYDEYGWAAAATLNARVRAAFGRIEMRRMLRALGKEAADDVADAVQIIQAYYQQVLTAGFDARFTSGEGWAAVTVTRCAALSGARRAALERHDQPCVACGGLWQAYLGVLLPDTPVEVEVQEQMGCGASQCRFVLRVKGGSR